MATRCQPKWRGLCRCADATTRHQNTSPRSHALTRPRQRRLVEVGGDRGRDGEGRQACVAVMVDRLNGEEEVVLGEPFNDRLDRFGGLSLSTSALASRTVDAIGARRPDSRRGRARRRVSSRSGCRIPVCRCRREGRSQPLAQHQAREGRRVLPRRAHRRRSRAVDSARGNAKADFVAPHSSLAILLPQSRAQLGQVVVIQSLASRLFGVSNIGVG